MQDKLSTQEDITYPKQSDWISTVWQTWFSQDNTKPYAAFGIISDNFSKVWEWDMISDLIILSQNIIYLWSPPLLYYPILQDFIYAKKNPEEFIRSESDLKKNIVRSPQSISIDT